MVNIVNTDNETPLHNAAYQGSIATVKLLLNAGAETNVKDESGRTPLHCAIISKKWTVDVCLLLIGSGAGVNTQDKEGNTPLHLLCSRDTKRNISRSIKRSSRQPSRPNIYKSVITLLLDNGANREILNNRVLPALNRVCRSLVPETEDIVE